MTEFRYVSGDLKNMSNRDLIEIIRGNTLNTESSAGISIDGTLNNS